MVSADRVSVFLGAAFLLTISPGPDILATVSIGLARGWRSAVGFGAGCGTGCLFHTGLAVAGVAAVIRSSPVLFQILTLSGAAWLAWLGIGAIRSRGASLKVDSGEKQSGWQYFRRGLLANVMNPKVAIFFLSFLPGFVDHSQGAPEWQMAVFGTLFTAVAVLSFSVIGYFSGRVGSVLQSRPGVAICLDRLAGLVFLGLALRVVLLAI